MKISFNPTTNVQVIIPGDNDRIVQNSSGNKVYLYGIEAGWKVKATFTRRDGFQIGLIGGVYDLDPDDEYCYIIPIPEKATEVDKGLGLSILIYEPSGEKYIRHSTIATSMYVYTSTNVIVPDDLDTVLYDAVMLAISNLTESKLEHSALVGTTGEIAAGIDKDTEVYTMAKTEEVVAANSVDDKAYTDTEVAKIVGGTYIADKATNDKDGNPIDTTYETKSNATAERAVKANLAGGNNFEGNQSVNGTINAEGITVVNASITSQLYKNNTKIVNLGNGSSPGDAVNKGQLDTGLALKENSSNKVQEVVVGGTEEQYVSAAALYNKFLTKVDKEFTIAGLNMQSGSITKTELKAAIGEAITSANGLMSATDKQRLDALHAMLGVTDDADIVVNTINEIMAIFATYPEGADILTALNGKVDKEVGKGLSENDLTDTLKDHYDTAYTHSQIKDKSNPHNTSFANITDKPTTRDGFGITDVYTKPETYTQLEINALLDNLSAVKGLKSTLLTPTELSNGDTISTNLLTNNGAYIVFTATDTSTGEIDSDTVPVSTIITGKKFVFFDNQEIVFTIGETNSTFETSEDITLKINLLYLDDENVQAISVDFDGSLTNYLLTQTNVQEAIEQLDNELKTIVGDIDDIEDGTTIVAKSTGDKNGNDIVATYETKADATTHKTRTTALENANLIKSITRSGSNLFTITYYDDTTSSLLKLAELKSFIGEATQSLSGLMSAQDKVDLDTLMALFDSDGDSVVNTIAEILAIFNNYPEGADLVTALAGKVNKADIVDNLTSTDTNKPLSANQGKALKDLVDATVGNIDAILDSILGV